MTTVLRLLLAVAAAVAAGAASGTATTGRQIFLQRDLGNCIACHQVSDAAGPAVRANVGPRLDAARLKGWDRARLRALLEDPQRANPDTVMPPYGRHRLLDGREIERLIDYLHALP
jgi:sulfur-oxidizing protein SoxX